VTSKTIQRVLGGDVDAFRGIVREHDLMLRSFLGSQLHHSTDIDDLAQEVFIIAFRKLKEFDITGDFGAWLRGIARKQLLHHFRTVRRSNAATARFREQVIAVVEQDLERAFDSKSEEAIEALLRCIAQLPPRMRRVVRGGLDGIKPLLLADELSTSVGAIYNLHFRANSLLRSCVQGAID
jgi:RNA polymerase sigma-70 factor, ECF subfamily